MISLETEFNSLLHSDLSCAGTEAAAGVLVWFATISLAHVGLGLGISAFVLLRGLSVRWLWGGLGLIVAKELAFDIPNGGFALLVIADSFWDLACYLIGFFTLWGLMLNTEGQGGD